MKIHRKLMMGIALALSVGAVFWMRALASWRPVTVAKVGFRPWQLCFSHDGKWVLAQSLDSQAAFINVTNQEVDTKVETDFDFDKKHGLRSFPRVWMSQVRRHLNFSAAPNRNVRLGGAGKKMNLFFSRYSEGVFPAAWSNARGEVYSELLGEIWIWNWRDGALKKRVRYTKPGSTDADVSFSPDGQWLLSFQVKPDGNGFLRRYDVQSGKMMGVVNHFTDLRDMGFSPDGRFFWWVQSIPQGDLNVVRVDNWKWQWSRPCEGPVKWLPDGRIGIVQTDGFDWRDASGRELRHLPGPFFDDKHWSYHVTDWALSPDGNWIYAADGKGTIRKWRAR